MVPNHVRYQLRYTSIGPQHKTTLYYNIRGPLSTILQLFFKLFYDYFCYYFAPKYCVKMSPSRILHDLLCVVYHMKHQARHAILFFFVGVVHLVHTLQKVQLGFAVVDR